MTDTKEDRQGRNRRKQSQLERDREGETPRDTETYCNREQGTD